MWQAMSNATNAGDAIAQNAAEAVESGRGSIEALIDWFQVNREDLPLGLAVAGIIVLVMLLLRALGAWLAKSDPDCRRWRGVIGRVFAKTGIIFMVATALDVVVSYAEVPNRLERLFDVFFIVTFAIQGAVWARELVLGLIGRRAADDEIDGGGLANAMGVIRVLVSVALFTIAIIVILDNVGVNVTALIAGLGIGGIAIGLAAQGIFSDLFAALAILFDRPFRRGDTIQLRHQRRHRRKDRSEDHAPPLARRPDARDGEHQAARAGDPQLRGGHSRRTVFTFGVIYQTPPDVLDQIPELARSVVESSTGCAFVRCSVRGFGASSIDFDLLFDSATVDLDQVGADRNAVLTGLMRMFQTHGIEFAYPTQTTFTAAPDGTLVMPYAQVQPVAIDERGAAKSAAKGG